MDPHEYQNDQPTYSNNWDEYLDVSESKCKESGPVKVHSAIYDRNGHVAASVLRKH